jgi:hypothetical protein
MSWMQTLSVLSFKRYNPDWAIKIHLIKQIPQELGANVYVPEYTGEDHFQSLSNFDIDLHDIYDEGIANDKHGIQVSDILRMRLLHRVGGVYSDFDTLWLKPMSKFYEVYTENFETTICQHAGDKHHNASNLVSEPNGSFLAAVIALQNRINRPPYDYQAYNNALLNRWFRNWDRVKKTYPRLLKIDYETFYPYDVYHPERQWKEDNLSYLVEKTVAVHWFNGNNLSKEFINRNDYTIPCSITSILKKEGYL